IANRLSLAGRQAASAWTFLAIPLVFYAAVRFWPAAQAVYLSFTSWNLLGPERWVGLQNYAKLLEDPVFWAALRNSLLYVGLGLPVSMGLSFLVAYHLDRVRFGHGLLRALYFLPHLTTAAAMAWVWQWFY